MQEVLKNSKDLLKRRSLRYVFVGGTTFGIDLFLLVLLHSVIGVDLLIAATISYWLSIVFNFLTNRVWTFEATATNVGKNAVVYLTLLAVNYLFSIALISVGTSIGVHFAIAKIIATGLQTIWTYIAYKKFVFK